MSSPSRRCSGARFLQPGPAPRQQEDEGDAEADDQAHERAQRLRRPAQDEAAEDQQDPNDRVEEQGARDERRRDRSSECQASHGPAPVPSRWPHPSREAEQDHEDVGATAPNTRAPRAPSLNPAYPAAPKSVRRSRREAAPSVDEVRHEAVGADEPGNAQREDEELLGRSGRTQGEKGEPPNEGGAGGAGPGSPRPTDLHGERKRARPRSPGPEVRKELVDRRRGGPQHVPEADEQGDDHERGGETEPAPHLTTEGSRLESPPREEVGSPAPDLLESLRLVPDVGADACGLPNRQTSKGPVGDLASSLHTGPLRECLRETENVPAESSEQADDLTRLSQDDEADHLGEAEQDELRDEEQQPQCRDVLEDRSQAIPADEVAGRGEGRPALSLGQRDRMPGACFGLGANDMTGEPRPPAQIEVF